MNATSSNNSAMAQSLPNEMPLFTFGAHAIQPATRAWDRAPRSPRKDHRRGIKVWKRTMPSQETDSMANAQLLGDLAASLSGHAAKRQRVQHMPAVPMNAPRLATYTSTITDSLAPPRRKTAKRRKSTRISMKIEPEALESPPRKNTPRRRSSIKPVSRRQSRHGPLLPESNDVEPMSFAAFPAPEEIQPERSFLDTVDLRGSTMFDREEADQVPIDDSTLSSNEENSGAEGSFNDEEEDEASEDDEQDDEDVEQGLNSTARLLDAGNTGVVDVPTFGEDSDDDEFDSEAENVDVENGVSEDQTADHVQGLELQENVSELLQTPPKNQPIADDKSAAPSPAAEDETLRMERGPASPAQTISTPAMQREETGSTVEFDEGFIRSSVIRVKKDHVFLSPVKAKDSPRPSSRASPCRQALLQIPDLRIGQASPQTPEQRQEKFQGAQAAADFLAKVPEGPEPGLSDEESIEVFDAESEDELFDGEPAVQGMVFSPLKQKAGSPSRSPSPNKTRSAPRLSDDTTYLNDFLSRVKAQAAAKTSAQSASPVKSTTPRRSPRKVLEPLDANSPSPSPARRRSKDNGSPIQLPKTPTAKLLTENMLSSPETPDELGGPSGDGDGLRRSGRSRLQAPTRLVMAAPNAIPLRRADGEPYLLQRTETQKLAMATRANTRRNKGNAVMPKSVLETLEGKELSPVKQREMGRNRKGQNVDWDNNLVYFLGEQKTRSKRKAIVLAEDEAEGKEPKESMEPAAATPMPKKKKAVRITRTPRAAKSEDTAAVEEKENEHEPEKEKEEEKVEAAEETSEAKPMEAEKKTHASRLRKPRATAIPTASTPAAKRAAAAPADSAPSAIPAPRRRTRRT